MRHGAHLHALAKSGLNDSHLRSAHAIITLRSDGVETEVPLNLKIAKEIVDSAVIVG